MRRLRDDVLDGYGSGDGYGDGDGYGYGDGDGDGSEVPPGLYQDEEYENATIASEDVC